MIQRLRVGVVAALVACVALIGQVTTPASAAPVVYAGGGLIVGTANTPGGLWFPVAFCGGWPGLPNGCPSAHGTGWSFSSSTELGIGAQVDVMDPLGADVNPFVLTPGNVNGGGSFDPAPTNFAYCGGSIGSGTATAFGAPTSYNVRFVSVGGTVVLVGTAASGTAGVAVATVQARPLPSGATDPLGLPYIPCLTQPATNFTIVGVVAGAGVL